MRPRISFLDWRAALTLVSCGIGCGAAALGSAGCAGKPGADARAKNPANGSTNGNTNGPMNGSMNGPMNGPTNGPTNAFHQIPIVSVAGQTTPFSKVLAERPALVSFWAPWCDPCVKELPELERLSRSMVPCGAAVLGVAVGETPATIAAFTSVRNLTYPQFTDQNFLLADALGQTRVPTTVVFDSAQRVVFVGEGLDRRAIAALTGTFVKKAATDGCVPRDPFETKSAEGQPP